MTPFDPRLGEIEALVDGLTDLCPEHMRQGIRHLQRNCDIDCNTHDSEDTWMACKQPDRYDGERMALALASIPYLLAELRKAQDALGRVEGLCVEADAKSAGLCKCHRVWVAPEDLRAAVAAATGGGDQ